MNDEIYKKNASNQFDDAKIAQCFNPLLAQMNAYKVIDLPNDALKLDAMEVNYQFPNVLRQQWLAILQETAINKYPCSHNIAIEKALRKQFNIANDCDIIFGNGSDEIIQIVLTALRGENRFVLSVNPSFVMYEQIAKLLGFKYIGVDLNDDDFSLNLPALLKAIATHRPIAIFIANPNNPTGNLFNRDDIEQIIAAANGLVIIDEAYAAFANEQEPHFVERYRNVVVMRTLSKTGFAGIRFGYLFGAKKWITEFAKVRPPYNVNTITQVTVDFVLRHYQLINESLIEIKHQRELLAANLRAIKSVENVFASQANFLLVKFKNSQLIYDKLCAANIWVKNFSNHPKLNNCLRITISNSEENNIFLQTLIKICEEINAT